MAKVVKCQACNGLRYTLNVPCSPGQTGQRACECPPRSPQRTKHSQTRKARQRRERKLVSQ